MSNEALQALIDEFGDRICMIIFDNNSKIHIGYPSSPIKSVNELILKQIGGEDMLGVPRVPNDPKSKRLGVTATIWHPTQFIQAVVTMDEGFEEYRLDPFDIG